MMNQKQRDRLTHAMNEAQKAAENKVWISADTLQGYASMTYLVAVLIHDQLTPEENAQVLRDIDDRKPTFEDDGTRQPTDPELYRMAKHLTEYLWSAAYKKAPQEGQE